MNVSQLVQRQRAQFQGFNPPVDERLLSQLQEAIGQLPDELLSIYRDHNGSTTLPRGLKTRLPARLMPIEEVFEMRSVMESYCAGIPKIGSILWVWTDDNSNYCGIYTSGILSGWLTRLDHEEPILTPVFRSIEAFMSRLLAEPPIKESAGGYGRDLISVAPEIPSVEPNSTHAENDRKLAAGFRELFDSEHSEDQRRIYAQCSICLTPAENTKEVLYFLDVQDTWIPEDAVRLLELRGYQEGIAELEKLAREGGPNGDSAALRQLFRLSTNPSLQAIVRLKQALTGQKLQLLEKYESWAVRLHSLKKNQE